MDFTGKVKRKKCLLTAPGINSRTGAAKRQENDDWGLNIYEVLWIIS
jgi:hypothetical protein